MKSESPCKGPYFFLFLIIRFSIHAIINPHTMTSPNMMIPAAPTVLTTATVITINISNTINKIINKHILHHLLFIKGDVNIADLHAFSIKACLPAFSLNWLEL